MTLSILFYKMRLRAFFSKGNLKELLINTALIIVAVLVSSLWIKWYDRLSYRSEILSADKLIYFTCLFIFIFPTLIRISFGDIIKKFHFSRHYPRSRYEVAWLDLTVFGILRAINLTMLIFIGDTTLLPGGTSHLYAGIFSLFFLSGILLSENMLNAIAFRSLPYLILILFLFIGALYMFNENLRIPVVSIYFPAVLTAVLLLIYFLFYKTPLASTKRNILSSLNLKNKYLLLAIRKKPYRKTLVVAMGFKAFILIYVLIALQNKLQINWPETGSTVTYFLCICFAPMIIFTYMHNNIWGYFPSLATNLVVSEASHKEYLMVYFKLLFPSILIDFVLTLIIAAIIGAINFQAIGFYFIAVVYGVIIGFIASFIKYRRIEKPLSFTSLKTNSSLVMNMATVFGVLILAYIAIKLNWESDIVLLVLLIGFLLTVPEVFMKRWASKLKLKIGGKPGGSPKALKFD